MFDYGRIVRRSVDIVKKNKWLLVYGALVAGGMGSGGGGGGGGGKSNTINSIKSPELKLEDLPRQTSNVLGAYTNTFKEWLTSVSPITWILIVLAIIIAVLIGTIVSMVLRSWATASLITGVQMALFDQPVDLTNTSPAGKAKTKKLIVFSLISAGIVFLAFLTLAIFGFVLFFLYKSAPGLSTILSIIIVIPAVIFLVVGLVMLSMVSIYGERLIVISNFEPWDAWKTGLTYSKSNFSGTAIMGLVNSITAGIFVVVSVIGTLVVFGIPIVIMVYPSIAGNKFPSPIVFIVTAIFVLMFIGIVSLVSAASQVFKFSNWNQVFNEVVDNGKKSDEVKPEIILEGKI